MRAFTDWREIRDRVDILKVATALMGEPPGRRGERGGTRRWWVCPFHEDRNPSLCVDSVKGTWYCFGCHKRGDAPALVMGFERIGFREAVARVAELEGLSGASTVAGPTRRPAALRALGGPARESRIPTAMQTGLHPATAWAMVEDAVAMLWSPLGAKALAYLRRRGLAEATIRAARLGVVRDISIPDREGHRLIRAKGVVIPWFEWDRLTRIKIRQPDGMMPKYKEVFGDRATMFPGPDRIRPGGPLIIAEGEFDALLLDQELRDLAAVITLGSASMKPRIEALEPLLPASPWYLASDADNAGDLARSGWPDRVRRVRPPGPYKDWTEAAVDGVDLRRWWSARLRGIERPDLFTWDDLSTWRWGPAQDDPTPGLVVDRPDAAARLAAQKAVDRLDPEAVAEREAIRGEPLAE